MSKTIKIKTEYITLGQFLKYINIIDSGAHAKMYLLDNKVYVNDELENRRGRKLYPDYHVLVEGIQYIVES